MVQILLTDAPSTMIASAEVWISHIYLQGGMGEPDEDGGGRVDLFNDPESPLHYDLLKLQDGLTADLTGFVEIEAGLYQGLRLVVDHAQVTLTDGLLFLDDTDTAVLKVPSGSESGIKVKLADVINAVEGESTTITVDFDVDRNFVIQGGQGQSPIRDAPFYAGPLGTRPRQPLSRGFPPTPPQITFEPMTWFAPRAVILLTALLLTLPTACVAQETPPPHPLRPDHLPSTSARPTPSSSVPQKVRPHLSMPAEATPYSYSGRWASPTSTS